jgi:hypothetical protein
MHGILFTELRRYVGTKFGKETWNDFLKNAGLETKAYMPFEAYPDEEMMALVATASKMTGQPASNVLQDFGEFIAPDLLIMYQGLIKPEWRTLDVLEHTEATIHTVVRQKNAGAEPPELVSERRRSNEVVITYRSARKMCDVAKGIAKGMAKHYNEQIVISEASCMLKGDAACVISVKLVK